MLIIGFIIT